MNMGGFQDYFLAKSVKFVTFAGSFRHFVAI